MVKAKVSDQEVKKFIDDFIESLEKNKLHVRKVVLFGSYARGNPRDYSDIDLAIISDKFTSNRWQNQTKIAKATESDQDYSYVIEPIGYSTKEYENAEQGSFLDEIKRTGKTVYSK